MARFRLPHLVLILVLISLGLFLFTGSDSSSPASSASSLLSFCPYSTSTRHVPTVILQGDSLNHRTSNRTFFVGGPSPAPFLPYSYPPRDLRIAQHISDSAAERQKPGRGRLGQAEVEEQGKQLCKVHTVPSSPPPAIPKGWTNSRVMFGMSTTPDRVLYNLPVWSHWLPAASGPLEPGSDAAKDLPLVLILTPPPNPTEAARMREAVDEAQALGMHVEMRKKESDRFETRYFSLAEEMWKEALRRNQEEGIKTEWFVFSDDDTFFPDFASVVRMFSLYDPAEPILLGALSESTHQVAQWGHISYGGAGIYVSWQLMALMNTPGQVDDCLAKFGAAFGGDAMVSHCAALVTKKEVKDILIVDDTLHQLDIRGDGTGWFQSGFLITSLHHWGSWFTLFPPWHESGSGDLRKGITLVGKAGKGVGGDNWGRRYVFEDGKVVVNLGYSITLEGKPLTESELGKSEHTWWEFETFHPIRPNREESVEKRTYYITNVRNLEAGIVRLEHKNREGERVDVIWDGRVPKSGWGWKKSSVRMARS